MAVPNVAISENFGDLLDPRFRKIYQSEYKEAIDESMIPMLFKVMSQSSGADYRVSGIGGMGDIPTFDGSITYDSFSQLYDKTITFPEYALGFKVERKLADDDLFGIMDQKPAQLAVSVARTREKAAAAVFNTAFTSTDNADGVALCSSSHPYSPDDSTTIDNAGTSALSAVSVEATRRIGLTSIFNDRGEIADVNYDTLLVPVNLEETAYEIINSKGKVDTANNNQNFHYGRYKLAVWRRLTDSKSWFFIDSGLIKQFLYWIDRVKPEFKNDRDFDTMMAKWSVYMRFGVGSADWRFIYGHLVA